MQYLVLIYESEARFANGLSRSRIRRVRRFRQEARQRHQRRQRASAHSNCQNRACTRQQDAHHRWSLRGDQRAAWRLLPDRSGQHRRGSLDRIRHPGGPLRQHRSPAHHGLLLALSIDDAGTRLRRCQHSTLHPVPRRHREQYFVHASLQTRDSRQKRSPRPRATSPSPAGFCLNP